MITLDDLIDVNRLICTDSGEGYAFINEDNLLSALSVQQWYSDDCLLASALIRSISIAHGFRNGNKRTAACIGMYVKEYECSEDELIQCVLDITAGKIKDMSQVASILYPNSFKE